MDVKGMTFLKAMNPLLEALNKYVEIHAHTLNGIYEQRAKRTLPFLPGPHPIVPTADSELPYRLIESYNIHFPDRDDLGTLWLFNKFFCVTVRVESPVPETPLSYLITPREYDITLTQQAIPGIFFDSQFQLIITDTATKADIATVRFANDVKGTLCCGIFTKCIADSKMGSPKRKKEGALSDFIAEHLGIGGNNQPKVPESQVHFAMMTLKPSAVNGTPQTATHGKTTVVVCKDGSGLDLNYRATSKLVKRQKYIAFSSVSRMERDMERDNSITLACAEDGESETITLAFADKVAEKAMVDLQTAFAAFESGHPLTRSTHERESKSSSLGGAMKATAPRLARFVQTQMQSARDAAAAATNSKDSDAVSNRETERGTTPTSGLAINENEEYGDALDGAESANDR